MRLISLLLHPGENWDKVGDVFKSKKNPRNPVTFSSEDREAGVKNMYAIFTHIQKKSK